MKLTTQQQVEMTITATRMQIRGRFVSSMKMKPVKPDASIIRTPMAWSPQNALWFDLAHGDGDWESRLDFSPAGGKIQIDFTASSHDELFLNAGKNRLQYLFEVLTLLEAEGFHTYGGIKPTEMDLTGLFGISWSKGMKKGEETHIIHRIATRQIFGATYSDATKARTAGESSGYAVPIRNNEYTSLR